MSLYVDLTPEEEARFRAFALKIGSDPSTLARKLLIDPLPVIKDSAPIADEENAVAIAQLKAWLDEEMTDDPEEIRAAEEELAEFKRNMNANRAVTGDLPVYR